MAGNTKIRAMSTEAPKPAKVVKEYLVPATVVSVVLMLLLINLGAAIVVPIAVFVGIDRLEERLEERIIYELPSKRILFLKILVLKPDIDHELAKKIAQVVDEAARDFNRDPDFILAIMSVESHFDPKAVSSVGAQGLMQVMPLWLKVMGAEGDDLFDPRINVRRGLQIYNSYEQMLKSKELALTAYNRGSWRVEEDLRNERDPRNGYAKEVLDVYERLKLMQ